MIVLEENNYQTITLGVHWIGNDKERLEYWLTEACHAIADADLCNRPASMLLAHELQCVFEDQLEQEITVPMNGENLSKQLAHCALSSINWKNIAEGLIEKHLEQCRS